MVHIGGMKSKVVRLNEDEIGIIKALIEDFSKYVSETVSDRTWLENVRMVKTLDIMHDIIRKLSD